jgi:Fe-S oxidoreductase
VLLGDELDSPRGRIYLISLAEKGEIGLEGPFATHIDRCLGCMACVTSCPSGVRYDRLIEGARAMIEQEAPRRLSDRLVRTLLFKLLPYPRRLGVALRLAPAGRALPLRGRLGAMTEIAPPWRSASTPDASQPRSASATPRILRKNDTPEASRATSGSSPPPKRYAVSTRNAPRGPSLSWV